MVLNQDFKEFIELLNAHEVKYLLVGGYAVALHGYPRYTQDIDFWFEVSEENANRIIQVLKEFGFGSLDIHKEDFLNEEMVIQLGYPPNRIDLIMGLEGVEFNKCFPMRKEINMEGLEVKFIDVINLIKNKKTVGRMKDLADAENLEAGKKNDEN